MNSELINLAVILILVGGTIVCVTAVCGGVLRARMSSKRFELELAARASTRRKTHPRSTSKVGHRRRTKT